MAFDVIIVGSGLAALAVALNLPPGWRVALLAKGRLTEGASQYAQGGIAAALDEEVDSIEQHVADTLIAGAGLCDPNVTRHILTNGPAAIGWLRQAGVPFTCDANATHGLHLTREGGHSRRRIIHAADATGQAVMRTLTARLPQQANIRRFECHQAIDLLTVDGRCVGVQALDIVGGGILTLRAPQTVLATGGAGRIYLHTTNPETATGDGIALAWRAGCRVANLEFIQFHPTSLYVPQAGREAFLISEAVRGEGGVLCLPDGSRFMPNHDARGELAPRDVVTRAIDIEMKNRGLACVYLDISHQPAAFLRDHFPTIMARCGEAGIDLTSQPIPVVPAAHYVCGGIHTDLAGRTDLAGLYAVGETACSGLHGANRLASNSLLECVVMGRACAQALESEATVRSAPPLPAAREGRVGAERPTSVKVAQYRDALRQLMWAKAGIVRSNETLAQAASSISHLRAAIDRWDLDAVRSRAALELRNMTEVAGLVVRSALARQESRGLHYNRDHLHTLPQAVPTVLQGSKAVPPAPIYA